MSISQPDLTYPSDDITPTEIWRILSRRKWWVFVFLAAGIAVGIGYVLVKAPVYEARVKIRIGQVAAAGSFESAETLSSRLLSVYGHDAADGVVRERPFLKVAAPAKGGAPAIELAAEGDNPDEAAAFLKRVFEDVQQSHANSYRKNVQYLTDRLQNIDKLRAGLQRQYDDATTLLEQLKLREPVQASLLMLERGRVMQSMTDLDSERPGLMQKLTPPQTQPTELLGEITAPASPAAPKKALVVALSAVLGLAVGLAFAFAGEFLAQTRSAER